MTPPDLRIRKGVERGRPITFTFEGQAIEAYEGESVAAALWAAGVRTGATGEENADGPPYRALFCLMGVCQQCVVRIDGHRIEACRVAVRDGIAVRSER